MSIPRFTNTFTSWEVWGSLALDDLWLRYRRTILGPLWITLAQGIWIFGIYLAREAFGGAGGTDANYYLQYLTIGLLLFNFVGIGLGDGPSVLQRSAGLILNYPISASLFVVRGIAGATLTFLHALPVLIIVFVATHYTPTAGALFAIPGLIALLLFVTGLFFLFGALGARYRDIAPATGSASALLFILTPVMWIVSPTQASSLVITLNPIYYLISAIRQPLLGEPFDFGILMVAMSIGVATTVIGVSVYLWQKKDIAYWL